MYNGCCEDIAYYFCYLSKSDGGMEAMKLKKKQKIGW